jgi:hypothetical protein
MAGIKGLTDFWPCYVLKSDAFIIVSAASAPFRAVELVGRGLIPGRRRRGMNPPAISQTRLKPAAIVAIRTLAETMLIAKSALKGRHIPDRGNALGMDIDFNPKP